jgi:acetoin utilization deacetylase AcuC-like enzyme
MEELALFYPQGHEAHYETGHPERPDRVEVIRRALEERGHWEKSIHLDPLSIPQTILRVIHDPAYLSYLETACQRGQHLDMDTYTTPASWDLALNSAGGAGAVATCVWRRDARRGFALTRPPGHHATSNRGMGFCLLNNISLATEYLLQKEGAQRLAIIDLDLHHGNGTQEIFWRRAEVFYLSTHQFPHYPGTGYFDEMGAGIGDKTTANIPFPPLSGDQAYQTAMQEVILPLLNRFAPEMILVSFGFDPHWRDPLGQLLLSADGYARLIASLSQWADEYCEGRIALFLEGGYDLEAAAVCATTAVAALLGKPWEDTLGPSPQPEGHYWRNVLEQVRRVWGL